METETDTPAGVAPAPTCTLIPAGTGGLQSGRQHQSYFEGISSRSAGSHAICMHLVLIPPAAQTAAHLHAGHETAIYVLSGSAETWYGPGLEGAPGGPPRGTSSTSPPGCPTWPATSARASLPAPWWRAPIRTSKRASSCCPSWSLTGRRRNPSRPHGRPGTALAHGHT